MKVTINIPDWAKYIVSDLTDMDRNPHPVEASKVSSFTLELPDDVYFEYAFLDADGKMHADPENETRADNPWYPEVSAVKGPEYRPDPYAGVKKELETGESHRHRLSSAVLKQERRLVFYTPKGHEGGALPCLFVQDGTAYLRIANVQLVMEALLRDGQIRPAHLVFIEPIDRSKEYPFNADYRTFIYDELFPFVGDRLKLTGEHIAMGASLGGLVSATMALERPELFHTVVTQSGAFLGTPEDRDYYRSERSWVAEQLESGVAKEVRWYTEVGALEWLLDVNRRTAKGLDKGGYQHEYQERNAGHNWTNWRNGLSLALRFALRR